MSYVIKHIFTNNDEHQEGYELARNMIKDFAGVSEVNFVKDANGKPQADVDGVFFSISHSKGMVVCAVSEHPIGVDVEKIRPVSFVSVPRLCTENECKYLFGDATPFFDECEDEETLKRFYTIWTVKEAYFKVRGNGEFSSVDSLSVGAKTFTEGEYVISICE